MHGQLNQSISFNVFYKSHVPDKQVGFQLSSKYADSVSNTLRNVTSRPFQTRRLASAKDLSPNVVLVRGIGGDPGGSGGSSIGF